jgi:hypothetical protein
LAPSGINGKGVPFPVSTPYFRHEIGGLGGLEDGVRGRLAPTHPPALDRPPKGRAA